MSSVPSRYFLTFFSEFFPQRQHTFEDEWTLVSRRTTFAMFFKRRLGTRRKTRPEFGGKSHSSGISTEKYQQDITTNYLEATNTSPIPLWGNFVSKRLGKWKYLKTRRNWSIDQKTKRQPTLAYFAYSDRRSLWRSRMMLGVILSEPRNMKKRPSRMFRLRITKPWPISQSIGLLSPQSEKQIMKKIISPSADICKLAAWGFKSRCTQLWCYLQLFKG